MNDQPYHPPLADVPPPIMPERPSVWPLVLGIIGVLIGLYGICGGAINLFSAEFTKTMLTSNPGMQSLPQEYFDSLQKLGRMGAIVSLPTAVLLIVASILLIMRRPSARGLWMTWALVSGIGSIVMLVVSMPIQRQMIESMTASDPNLANNPAFGNMMNMSTGIGAVCGGIFALALPVFTLIWFSLAKVRQEIEWWRQRRATPGGPF